MKNRNIKNKGNSNISFSTMPQKKERRKGTGIKVHSLHTRNPY